MPDSNAPDPDGAEPAADANNADADNGEATRVRLINATIELLNNGGNHALRVADVAKDTGVAVSTIYAHFRDRTDLVAAARLAQFRAHAEEALRAVDDVLDQPGEEPREMLAEVALWPTLRAPDDPESRVRRWDRVEAIADSRHIPALAEQLEGLQSELSGRATELVERAQRGGLLDPELDPAAIAMLTQVVRLGLVLWDLSPGARPTPENWTRLIERIILVGLAPAAEGRGEAADQPTS